MNSDVCSLTVMEAKLRGISREDALTHKFISPVYNINDNTWNKVMYIITISVMLYSVYKLQNSKICAQVYNEMMESSEAINKGELLKRIQKYVRICKPLFMV